MQASLRITVPLTPEEWNALKAVAKREKREPRMQASYLINLALLGNSKPVTDSNLAERTVNGFVNSQPARAHSPGVNYE